ncbi:hypothetical protein [Aureimonas glaciei]|uniref:Uncharacterized protein n=1 Tax=Aureimonas glaciei TaxID=1776957 RepID=A0A916Y516_9HYPH|nr:hypothetical protein [Aureimonas glaciei]GGD30835.1 hypothetical protein GCM10011335_37330 [Aureimonas glaciei]
MADIKPKDDEKPPVAATETADKPAAKSGDQASSVDQPYPSQADLDEIKNPKPKAKRERETRPDSARNSYKTR